MTCWQHHGVLPEADEYSASQGDSLTRSLRPLRPSVSLSAAALTSCAFRLNALLVTESLRPRLRTVRPTHRAFQTALLLPQLWQEICIICR